MRILHVIMAVILLMEATLAQAQRDDGIAIKADSQFYILTVQLSDLELKFPKSEMKEEPADIGGATSNPRYFKFNHLTKPLIVSGWFEHYSVYKGINQFWEGELNNWYKTKLPQAVDVSIEDFGKWKVVFYNIPFNNSISHANARAHYVQANTWIDLHISYTGEKPYKEQRAELESFLNSIVVNQKVSK